MKKLLLIAISVMMILTLGACSSKEEAEVEEENNRPIKTIELFGKEYKLPVTLKDLAEDGVEIAPVFIEVIGTNGNENVFLCKDGENIRVGVHNSAKELLKVTDPSLTIRSIIFQYKDTYYNAKDVPSIKLNGVGIGDNVSDIEAVYGEPTGTRQIDDQVFEKMWSWDDEYDCSIGLVDDNGKLYACQLWLPLH